MACLLRILLLLTVAAGTIGQQQPDRVILQNGSGNENGLLVWGDLGSEESPKSFKSTAGDISVGDVKHTEANQVVAFTAGRPPVLLSSVNWTSGTDTITLAFPNLYELMIKIWVLCANADCTGGLPSTKRANLAGFQIWANTRLESERTGIALRAAGIDWISDQTQNVAKRDQFGVDPILETTS